MLDADLAGLRKLFEASPREYNLARVIVVPENDVLLPPFTGKAVKSMLIKANPSLTMIFESEMNPKPIRISTMARSDDGVVHYLWKIAGKNNSISMRLAMGERAWFYVGFTGDVSHAIIDALNNIDGITLFGVRWRLVEYSMETYWLPTDNPPPEFRIDDAQAVKVEIRTPALLLDPYKESVYRRFLPLPGIVFSYNVGDLLRMKRGRDYILMVDSITMAMNETYSILNTVKAVKYVYGQKILPGLIGYAKYMIDKNILEQYQGLKLFIENLLIHAHVMGIGTSRANGFGHVTIKVIPEE